MNRPLLALVAVLATAARSFSQPMSPGDAALRRLAQERLLVLGSALYVGAHPDDENTALLTYLASERKVRVAYLSLTRGDGGQNLIGTEQGELLGIIRTEELLAARAIDGAGQLFTRAIDFGFSKTPAETLRLWDRDAVLADMVWALRVFRPDVVITRFPSSGDGGHGHHTASAILAAEAFAAAGDATRFREQLAFVTPWQPKRLLWNTWRAPGTAPLSVDLGTYNPLLGRSYTEIAAASRSMHKSQGFGAAARRGGVPNYFEHVAGEPARTDLFDGVPLTWERIPGGAAVAAHLERALTAEAARYPERSLPHLVAALAASAQLGADPWVEVKRAEILACIRSAAGLWLEATVTTPYLIPGAETKVAVQAVNRSTAALTLARLSVTHALPLTVETALPANTPVARAISTTLPQGTEPSVPYWLRAAARGATYAVAEQRLIGLPRTPPELTATVVLRVQGRELELETPVYYRFTDPVEGDVYRTPVIGPAATVDLGEALMLFPDQRPRSRGVVVRAQVAGVGGTVRLVAPPGWSIAPERAAVTLGEVGAEQTLDFTVTPPARASTGELTAVLALDGPPTSLRPSGGRPPTGLRPSGGRPPTGLRPSGGRPARAFVRVSHGHIPEQTLLPLARVRLVREELVVPLRRVGYVMGAGDEIPDVLRQCGLDVVLLSDADLAANGLQSFEAIVTGVRAYNTRAALRGAQPRLLEYVNGGGTLVVQYNTERGLVVDQLGPFPLSLSRERVTEEGVAVRLLAPSHPALRAPHAIVDADFDGWIQERGLYFAGQWDSRYVPLLGMHDGGEPEREGALVVARHGRGTYVYTGLSFFRQLPAGVPGALRLFVNLLACGQPAAP